MSYARWISLLEWARRSRAALLGVLFLAVFAAYSNHFQNSFHFDDFHTVVDNPAIRSLSNLPKFFTDATQFSVLPPNRSWRPLVSASLAVDYQLAGGLHPFAFHASTFFWYLLHLTMLFLLAERIFHAARPGHDNRVAALFTAALYGLHPVSAETVNYIIQRGALYSALGVLSGICLYAARPQWRKYGIYLLPVTAGQLSKPPALIFPAILVLFLRVTENRPWKECVRNAIPAFLSSSAIGITVVLMTPRTYTGGASSPVAYWMTQPFVLWRQVCDILVPLRLSADTDLFALTNLGDIRVVWGLLFVVLFARGAALLLRNARTMPIGFGMLFFLLANVPASIYPVGEVENGHRMLLPSTGLVIAIAWAAVLLRERVTADVPARRWATARVGDRPTRGVELRRSVAEQGVARRVHSLARCYVEKPWQRQGVHELRPDPACLRRLRRRGGVLPEGAAACSGLPSSSDQPGDPGRNGRARRRGGDPLSAGHRPWCRPTLPPTITTPGGCIPAAGFAKR